MAATVPGLRYNHLKVGTDFASAPVQPGDVVAGKYRVERVIGSGGMGVVVAARHLALDEPVALKFVLAHQTENREVVERFVREARATFRLRSLHTVRMHDVSELPDGHFYIVMELLEGRDLKAELAARGPLPPTEVVSHALAVCEALFEAHGLGIVHRDLKPGNLFLARAAGGGAVVKILDFGMSKLDPSLYQGGPLTRPETALGTPRYMAPEQWKSAADVDATADIWALGVVMYELLTGKTPLQGMTSSERQARMLAGAIPSPLELRPDVPEELARVVMRCLRADPRARWPGAVHLARALRSVFPPATAAESEPVTSTGVTVVVPPSLQARRAAEAADPLNDPRSVTAPATAVTVAEPANPRMPAAAPISSDPTPEMPKEPFPPARSFGADDFQEETEVRAPLFTPADAVAASGRPAAPRPPKRMAATLRSFEAPPIEAVREPEPQEKTLPLAKVPGRPAATPSSAPPAMPTPAWAMPPVEPQGRTLAVPQVWSTPPAAARPPAKPARRSNLATIAVAAALGTMLLLALVTWLVVRSR
jgi:serine/threonine-protein kinase